MSTITISNADLAELTRLIHLDQGLDRPKLSQHFALDWLTAYRDWIKEEESWRPDNIWLQREIKTDDNLPVQPKSGEGLYEADSDNIPF